MLLNSHLDELLYEHEMIVTNLPFAELKKISNINARGRAADQAADFSQQIRSGLPAPADNRQFTGANHHEKILFEIVARCWC